MAEINGKLCACDRCGFEVFLKCVGEGETDGIFARWNEFEPYPNGWSWHEVTGLLCPACESRYQGILNEFLDKSKVPKHRSILEG